jgi:hypothetical protein
MQLMNRHIGITGLRSTSFDFARAGAYCGGGELVTSPLRNIAMLTFRLFGGRN